MYVQFNNFNSLTKYICIIPLLVCSTYKYYVNSLIHFSKQIYLIHIFICEIFDLLKFCLHLYLLINFHTLFYLLTVLLIYIFFSTFSSFIYDISSSYLMFTVYNYFLREKVKRFNSHNKKLLC